jgi:hypothetical protein
MASVTGVIKLHAMLIPPKRACGGLQTRANITVRSAFTVFSHDGKKKVHSGFSFFRRWFFTPSRHMRRRRKVKMTIKTGLLSPETVNVHAYWTMPRAGHRPIDMHSTIKVNVAD